jgi:hypothetical protein
MARRKLVLEPLPPDGVVACITPLAELISAALIFHVVVDVTVTIPLRWIDEV